MENIEFPVHSISLTGREKIVRMNRNSLTLQLGNGEIVLIHRNVYNKLAVNPELPTYLVTREFQGKLSHWIATLSTL